MGDLEGGSEQSLCAGFHSVDAQWPLKCRGGGNSETCSMLGVQMWLLVLVLCAGNLDAWFWLSGPQATTETPTAVATTGATSATETPGAATTANATMKEEEEEEDDLSGVGEKILNVATGIHKFVKAWDVPPTARTEKVESANPNTTGNANRVRVGRVEEGSGLGDVSGSGSESGSDVESVMVLRGEKVLLSNVSVNRSDVFKITGTVDGVLDPSLTPASNPACLPVPSDWSICSGKKPKFFTLPNFFNHTSVEEVGAVLQEWAWLTKTGCHHSAEWFLCLLLAPRCPSPATPLPCRSFCQVLQDSCWASLENGRLPVECHLLPEGAPELGRPACVSVSNWKGNRGGLECIRSGNTF